MSETPANEPADLSRESLMPTCMVAMPFGEQWSQDLFHAIREVMRSVDIDVNRVDMVPSGSVTLSEHIENQFRTADMVVADLTGQNSNVHVEVGFAIANGKDILLCTQSSDDVCAHLREQYYIVYAQDKNGLKELSRTLRMRIKECMKHARLMKEKEDLERQLQPQYSVQCFKDRGLAQLHKVFHRARRRIDILTTNLGWLFKEVLDTDRCSWDYIAEAVESRVRLQLRVLTLNPESEIAAARGKQLGFSPGNFRAQLRNALDRAKALETKITGNRVEIRSYDQLPTQITFRSDDEVYTCIVGQPMQSRNYPVLRFHIANQGVKEAFLSHFLSVWKDATPA